MDSERELEEIFPEQGIEVPDSIDENNEDDEHEIIVTTQVFVPSSLMTQAKFS